MGERSDFDLTPGADDDSRPAGVVQIRERVRPRPAALEEDNRDPIQDWDTHHAGSLQLPVLDRPEGPPANDGAGERLNEVSVPHQRQLDSDAEIFNLRPAPTQPATTLPLDQTGPEEAADEQPDGGAGTDEPPEQQSKSLRRAPVAAPRRRPRRAVTGIALGAVIAIAAVIVGLAVSTASHHARPVTHVTLAATAAPLTSRFAQDATGAAKSTGADLTRAVKAVKARAAAVAAAARARQARAKARTRKARAARARAARIHKRREPTHTQTTPSPSPSGAATTSTYTQTTPAPSAPAQASSPSTATTSHKTHRPYGAGGLLGAGSSPSG